jgi:regulator of replication initiation timing
MLKKNLSKDDEIHKQDNIRIMRENVELIKEINKLRKQIKEIKFSQKGSEKGADPAPKPPRERRNLSNGKLYSFDFRWRCNQPGIG